MFKPQLDWRIYAWDTFVKVVPPTPGVLIKFCWDRYSDRDDPQFIKCYGGDTIYGGVEEGVTDEKGVWFKRLAITPNPVPCRLHIGDNSIDYLGYGRHYDNNAYVFEYHIETGEFKRVFVPILNIIAEGNGVTEPAANRYWATPREEITVTATPTAENWFSHFVDSTVEGNVIINPYTFTMESDRTVTAVFVSGTEPPEEPEPPTEGFNLKKIILPTGVIILGLLIAD